VADFKYLGTTLTIKILFRKKLEQIEVRECLLLFSAEFLISSLLSKDIKIKIWRTIILTLPLYGCAIWLLTLKVVRRQRAFENRVQRRIFVPSRNEGS
jgi:hypothetical protein